ncbi:MAG: autotransporter outer membrane beta-barrel domain-containing protein [Betaproteobacteria bacterium]
MSNLTRNGSLRDLVLVATGVAAFVAAPGAAFAQGNLATLPGLTELQSPVAGAVNGACLQFAPAGYTANPNGTPAERLFYTCRVMVQTANQLAGSGSTANSLGISNEELRTGVQAIAPVQMNAQKQIGTEALKMNLVGARLLDLRAGARGFVVGTNGFAAPAATRTAARGADLDGATGGGASADDLGGRLGGFLNLGYNWGNVDQTSVWDSYKYRNFSLLAGADYRVSDALVLGGALSYNDTRSTYDQSLGKVDATTIGVVGYGTYYVGDWYADGFLAYGAVDYDSVRNISIPSASATIPAIATSATAKPKGDQWSASVGVGRSFDTTPYSITPSVRLSYIWVKNKAFSEEEPINGVGLAVESRTIKSLQSSLGVKVSRTVNSTAGVFVPYFTAQWLHEFENDSPSIIAKYVNDPFNTVFAIPTGSPTRDYAALSIGSSAVFKNDLSAFVQFSTALGIKDVTNYGLVIGLRKQF